MPDASVAGLFRQTAQGVHHHLAEWLRICCTYLGIAVIVTVSMGLALPGLRDQALQVHKALLTALAPTSVPSGSPAEPGYDPAYDTPSAVAMAIPAASSNATGFLGPLRSDLPPAPPKKRARSTVSGPQVEALRNYISRKYRVAYDATSVLVSTVYKVAREKELDPLLLLAVIAIESRYNPFAESSMGAQGLMQVMTRVHQDKFDKLGDGMNNPLDPIANIRVGTTILRDCIDRRGSIDGGLACYVGATGPSDGGYGAKVQAERRRLALAAGIALARE